MVLMLSVGFGCAGVGEFSEARSGGYPSWP